MTISTIPIANPSGSYRSPVPYNRSSVTGNDGSAVFLSVPPGAYGVCAYPRDGIHVDSCSWEERPQSIYLNATRTVSQAIQLKRGQFVNVEITDANRLISSAPQRDRQLNVAIRSKNGHPQPIEHLASGASLRRGTAFVPIDTDLELLVASFGLDVANAAGGRLQEDKRTPVHVRVSAGTPAPTVRLTVLPKR